MQDLRCAHCGKILIADFWEMVEDETVSTFSSLSVPCSCGHTVQVVPVRQRRMKAPHERLHLHSSVG